ncbi:hypothetical protein VTO42DRAFT_127 [Malbranchea cinnamomea]
MEPFPSLEEEPSRAPASPIASSPVSPRQPRQSDASLPSHPTRLLRSASLKLLESNPPRGAWMATGEIAAQAPTLDEIRRGSFSSRGWSEEGQLEQRGNSPREAQRRMTARRNSLRLLRAQTARACAPAQPLQTLRESMDGDRVLDRIEPPAGHTTGPLATAVPEIKPPVTPQTAEDRLRAVFGEVRPSSSALGPDETGMYPNGYRFPPKHTWKQSITIGLKAFGRFTLTPFGFLVTLYCLNIVGWGAMIFFLLLNAAPAMCHPSCDADDSARKIWIEIDTQILNALFCVTAFGLIPWRFRDLYYLMKWRALNSHDSLRRLAGVHRSWYRLPGSDKLPEHIGPPRVYSSADRNNASRQEDTLLHIYTEEQIQVLTNHPAVPLPLTAMPNAPLTGVRAPPTTLWYLDLLVWMYVLNTAFQAALCGLVWGMNRHERSTAGVATLITLGCVSGAVAGLVTFFQGRRVKQIEGIPVPVDPDPDGLGKMAGHENLEEKPKTSPIRRLIRRDSHWYRRH